MFRSLWVAGLAVTVAGLAAAPAAHAVSRHKLPLGDNQVSEKPRKGYVYSCQHFNPNGGGAFQAGPWIDEAAGTWDLDEKIAIQGQVTHDPEFEQILTSSRNVLTGNGLPAHPTGVFPVAAPDPAFQYDRNPNTIAAHTIEARLPRTPRRATSATCAGGTVGVMRNGVPLFSAFDATGRDAGAWEIQDACDGHPERTGQYHYHSLPECISDTTSTKKHSKLLGWSLDGHGIYGLRGEKGKRMSNTKLDACHGHTHTITWNGKRRKMYHYHVTLEFPYAVGCYRGSPITSATGIQMGG